MLCYNFTKREQGRAGMDNILGSRIKNLRMEKNMSQRELAATLHISNSTLCQYESGLRIPSDEVKILISKYFGVTLDYLLGATNERAYFEKRNAPLTKKQGERIIQSALKDTGLLDEDGNLPENGEKVISDFLRSNAEMLKQLLNK